MALLTSWSCGYANVMEVIAGFLARFNPLRDEQGQITRWYVTGTDIDDRKQAEDTLRRENVALREEIDKASMFEEIVGTSPALQSCALAHFQSCTKQFYGPHNWRNGNGQRACCTRHPPTIRSQLARIRQRELRCYPA